jgi:endonuclease YncB( thermonuclease family)
MNTENSSINEQQSNTNDTLNNYKTLTTMPTKNYSKFTMGGLMLARIISVYDGDTITAGILLNLNGTYSPIKINMRCLGYNAPEMKVASEKELATACRDYLRSLIHDKVVLLDINDEMDKYGRCLGTIYFMHGGITNEHLEKSQYRPELLKATCANATDYMLTNTCCRPYDGGARDAFS